MTTDATIDPDAVPADSEADPKERLRQYLLSSPEGRRVLALLSPDGATDAGGDAPPPDPTDPVVPAADAADDPPMPAWAQAYSTWFSLRDPCHKYAGQALQHFSVLIKSTEWEGQQAVDALGSAISEELSRSAALKDIGQKAADPTATARDRGALQKELRTYLDAVAALATAVHEAADDARVHLVKQARALQKENVGAFHPELANGLVVGKQCVLLITQILTALAPVTLGVSAGVAAGINLAAKGMEALVIEAHVDEDKATVIALAGKKVDADTEDLEHLEKLHRRMEKVHEGAEQALKHSASLPVSEAVKGAAELGEKVAGGVGTAFAFAGFYLDIQKYDTTRKIVDSAPPETMARIQEAAEQVYALHDAKVIRQPVALLELVDGGGLGQGVRILQEGGKEGILYSSGIFIPSDAKYRFDIFLDRARKLQDAGEQDVRVNFAEPVTMIAESGTDFTLRATVHASPKGWYDFAGWYALEGRLTPEGLLRDFKVDRVPPFSLVPAKNREQEGKGTAAYPDWNAAYEVAARMNAKAKDDEAYYDDDRHPYLAITTVESKPYHDTGETVEVIVHLPGAPLPGDYNDWLDKVRSIRPAKERERRASEPQTDDHRGHASS